MLHNIISNLLVWMGQVTPSKITIHVSSGADERKMRESMAREAEDLGAHACAWRGPGRIEYFGIPFYIEVEPCSKCGRTKW